MSIQSNSLSTASASSLQQKCLREKVSEIETYSCLINEQIVTLQRYFDACSVSGGVQNLETDHGLRAVDFKGEAITFRETTSGVLTTLNHCLDIIMQQEDGLKKRLDREMEKRKKLEDELK